jgi:hypothetical protein
MKLFLKASEAKPTPEPIESNAGLAVLLGTLAWLLALLAILFWIKRLSSPFLLGGL